jgi:N-methylhydantoinase A
MLQSDTDLEEMFLELEARGRAEFLTEDLDGVPVRSVDLRYQGQGYELNIPFGARMLNDFHDQHKQRYGFANEQRQVEIVNIRVRMVAHTEPFEASKGELQDGDGEQALLATRPVYFDGSAQQTRIYDRRGLRPGDTLKGPAIITEYTSATILPPGDTLHVDPFDNLVIEIH